MPGCTNNGRVYWGSRELCKECIHFATQRDKKAVRRALKRWMKAETDENKQRYWAVWERLFVHAVFEAAGLKA